MVYGHPSSQGSGSGSQPGSVSMSVSALASQSTSLGNGSGPSGAAGHPQQHRSLTPPPSVASQPVKRRRYARRSCLTCRSKKTRCELPDEAVASSHDPLPVYKACHRCRALDIPCVVWDGNRKRKPRLESIASSSGPSRIHPSSEAQTQAQTTSASTHPRDSYTAPPARPVDQPYSNSTVPRPGHRDAYQQHTDQKPIASNDWYPTSNSSAGSSRQHQHQPQPQPQRRADLYERTRHAPDAAPSILATHPSPRYTPKTAAPSAFTSNSSAVAIGRGGVPITSIADSQYDAALFIDPRSSDSIKTKVTGGEIHILNNRFMHSPLVTLNRFITKIPSFSRLLRPEMDRSFDGQLASLLTDENIQELETHLPRLRMWHPHVPGLESLRTAFRERPKPSTSLLLATVCLVASKIAGKRHLAKHFAIHVDRIGLQVLISAPKELHAAQAFEILISHGPSLIGASVDPSSASSNDSAVFGESLHSSAISIAEGIGLDLVMSQALQSGVGASANDGHDNNPEHLESLRSRLRRFSLWCSLSMWRAKFVFLNSTIRPCDFSRLRRDAELAISMIDTLAQQDHPTDEPSKDESLFRAGVLALAYRAIQVADFHVRLSQLETLWNSRPLFSEVEVRREIRSRVDQHLEFLADFKRNKQFRFYTMANLAELKFLDRWIDLELGSDWVFLFQLYMRIVLPVDKAAATVLDVSHSIDRDVDLHRFLFEVGERSYLNDERVLANFSMTPRFEGESLEQTGLPLLLTCGYILHISICVMEGVSFLQYGVHDTAMREDMFALLLPKLAQRLCSPARSEVESLERLVSNMLVQMARRLEEWEVYKVIHNTKRHPSALNPQLSSTASGSNGHQRSSGHPGATAGQSPGQTSNSTQQGYATPSTDSGAAGGADASFLSLQTASDSAQPHSSRQGLAHLMNAQPGHVSNGVAAAAAAAGSDVAKAGGAVPFVSNADTLLPPPDTWSSDNMMRIMDQILSWDLLPDLPFASGNGASQ